MKLTFDGTLHDIVTEMRAFIEGYNIGMADVKAAAAVLPSATEISPHVEAVLPEPEPEPTKPTKPLPHEALIKKAKPKEDPEAAKVRMAKVRAARGKGKAPKPKEEPEIPEGYTTEFAPPGVLFPKIKVPEPKPPITDPAEIAAIRDRTIKELQEAYANGKDKEVYELLGRFGNGAKSFREVPAEGFLPIREAIDNGGLT